MKLHYCVPMLDEEGIQFGKPWPIVQFDTQDAQLVRVIGIRTEDLPTEELIAALREAADWLEMQAERRRHGHDEGLGERMEYDAGRMERSAGNGH